MGNNPDYHQKISKSCMPHIRNFGIGFIHSTFRIKYKLYYKSKLITKVSDNLANVVTKFSITLSNSALSLVAMDGTEASRPSKHNT